MLGELIGAGASILGGLLGNKSKEKAAQREYQQQKEFAQSGIQWKVADAEKAGVHPLYALGANTVSYAPQSVGGGSDYNWLGDAGQNIGRAIDATRSQQARGDARVLTALQLEGLQLDNEFKKAQINSLAATTPNAVPALPTAATEAGPQGIPGQGNAPQVDAKKTYAPTNPGNPTQEYYQQADTNFVRTKTGWAPTIPKDLAESFEQDWMGGWQWQWRNKHSPDKRHFNPPAHVRLQPFHRWTYNWALGEYQQKYDRGAAMRHTHQWR